MTNLEPLRRAGLGALLLFLASCAADHGELRLVVGGVNANREVVEGLGASIGEDDAFRVRLVEQGEQHVLAMLSSGEADLALVENTTPFRSGITSLLPVYTGVLHIAHRDDVDPQGDRDWLAGGKIFAGAKDSLSYILMRQFLAQTGLAETGVRLSVERDGVAPDLVAAFGPISPARLDAFEGYRLYSLSPPEDVGRGSLVDGLRNFYPQLRPYIIPIGTYHGLASAPVVTVAVDQVLVARDDLDSAAVYDLMDRLVVGRPALASRFPVIFDGMRLDFDPNSLNFPLHPGAQRFLSRDAPSVYERYAEVVDAGITVFLFLLSGSLALMRIMSQRRKNRIDVFYKELLEIRKRQRAGLDAAARTQALARVEALEVEAFGLLIEEKLAANESFRIFVTLCHDVMRELDGDATGG